MNELPHRRLLCRLTPRKHEAGTVADRAAFAIRSIVLLSQCNHMPGIAAGTERDRGHCDGGHYCLGHEGHACCTIAWGFSPEVVGCSRCKVEGDDTAAVCLQDAGEGGVAC